jgi:hypothetical protein
MMEVQNKQAVIYKPSLSFDNLVGKIQVIF